MQRFLWLVLACSPPLLSAQQSSTKPVALPIQDNSFLVEEAYNQGRGVVQHINTFARAANQGGWDYSFTQEWPFRSQRHQVSYTIPASRISDAGRGQTGVGDIALNYRYQAGRIEGAATAFAPRASLLLPTGDSDRGFGAGGAGLQFNLPFSAELPASMVVHSNAGATYVPRGRDVIGNRAATTGFTLAQSVIWLAHPKLNLMLEGVWNRSQQIVGPGRTASSTEFLISPGVRGAIDFSSGLQIVPGIAFPIGVGPSKGERSMFAYLSFEHPFAKQDSEPEN